LCLIIALVLLSPLGQGQSLGSQASYILNQHWVTLSKNGQRFPTIGRFLIGGGRKISGFRLHYSVMANHGGKSPTADIGDGQILSNIDTEGVESIKIYELYAAKDWGALQLSFGWRDLSNHFNVTDSSSLFINSSFTTTAEWGTTGFRGPSIYPQVSFGVHAWWQLNPSWYFGASVTDPLTPENYYPKQLQTHVLLNETNHMAVTELGFKSDKLHGAVGGWNMEQAERGLRARYQQTGHYTMVAVPVGTRLTPFFRYGRGTDRQGLIFQNRVAGLHINKAFSKKGLDELGLGYTAADRQGSAAPEEIYEIVYRYNFTPRLSTALSSQWVINPFFSHMDGQLLTLRIEIRSRSKVGQR
jgi:hypothetical protein